MLGRLKRNSLLGFLRVKGQVPEEELESGRAARRARAGGVDVGRGENPARFPPARFFGAGEKRRQVRRLHLRGRLR
jgi:hypothetical protein